MIKDITLGQFFPGKSLLHRIDPRMKLVITILYIVVIFLAKSIYALAAVAFVTLLLIPLGRIPPKMVLKSMKPLLIVILFTSVFNIFFVTKGTLLWEWKFISIYTGGLWTALCMIIRITVLIISTSMILSYTTSPIAIADGIEQLFPFRGFMKNLVHDFAMMFTIALRFIPILIDETDRIMSAQAARGADFKSGGLIRRAKALIPIFIPLFVSSIHHADELATAMECRCYHGGNGRTRMNRLKYHLIDLAALLATVAFGVGVVLISRNSDGFRLG